MPTFTARIKTEGGRTADSVSAALQELHAAGVPGNANVTFTGAMGGWAIEARWDSEAFAPPGKDYREANRTAIQEQLDNPLQPPINATRAAEGYPPAEPERE